MTTRDKIGWGVIGACGIAKRRTVPEGIVPATNTTLEALTDIDLEGARAMAEQFGGRAYATMEELLADAAVQAVYVATPNHLHKEHALAAAAAGKHVLCEKPLALTTADIREMIAACKDANVLLGCGFMMRYNVYHQAFKKMIVEGRLGTPVHARGQMTSWHPPGGGHWRHLPQAGGGGCVTDVASHVIDVMEMMFGRTKRVFCQCFNRVHDSQVEDTAMLQVVFESGVPAIIDVSFCVPSKANEYVLELYGSNGAIKCKYTLSQRPGGDVRACLIEDLGGFESQESARYTSGYESLELEPVSTYKVEIETFSQAILDDMPAPIPGEDGLWNHVVIAAAYESARTGLPVEPKRE